MKIYLIKYWLTTGYIEEYEVGPSAFPGAHQRHVVIKRPGKTQQWYQMGKDAFLWQHEAEQAALAMRDKQVELSLRFVQKYQAMTPTTKRVLT